MNPLQWLATALIRICQRVISPMLPASCKYYPSCSAYAVEAIKVQGVFKGIALSAWRLLRCNPWSRGGVDFPPGSTLEVEIPPNDDSAETATDLHPSRKHEH